MTELPSPDPVFRLPDPEVLGRSMADIAERSQRLVGDWLDRQAKVAPASNPRRPAA